MNKLYPSLAALTILLIVTLRLDAQNVGVGTSTPQQKLEVAGWIQLGDESEGIIGTAGSIRYHTTGKIQFYHGGAWIDLAPSDDDWRKIGGGLPIISDQMYHTGDVTIGSTSAPTQKLDLSGWLRLGDETKGTTGNAGAVRYHSSGKIQFHNGTLWTDLAPADDDWRKIGGGLPIISDAMYHTGDVAIGGSATPGAKLDVTGPATGSGLTIRAAGGGDVMLNSGGSLFFDGNYSYASGNYIRPIATNTQAFVTAGSERMRITSTGNVGIGTNNPQEKLEINGSIRGNQAGALRIQTATGYTDIGSQNSSWSHIQTDRPLFYFQKPIVVDGGAISSYDEDLVIRAHYSAGTSANQLTLLTNGNVGVGVSPAQKLDVNGQVRIRGGSPAQGSVLTAIDATGDATWDKEGRGQFNSATVTAGSWYRIASNAGDRANAMFTLRDYISSGGHSTMQFRAGASYNDISGHSFTMLNHNKYGSVTFTKVRILYATTYDPQYVEVYVNRTGDVDYSITDNFQSSGWVPVDWTAGSIPGGYSAVEYDTDKLFVVGDNDDRFTINRGGNVGIGTASPSYTLHVNGKIKSNGVTETSDARLKTNITVLPDALETVLAMRGVSYVWSKEAKTNMTLPEGTQIGMIAQEVEKILPQLVNTDADGYKSVEYSHMVAVLIEALKEQQALIGEQENRITALENIIEEKLGVVVSESKASK